MTVSLAGAEPGRRPMKAWSAYALASFIVAVAGAGLVSAVVTPAAGNAVWFSAVVAWCVQLLTFAGLIYLRDQTHMFVAGYMGGMVLRFGALGGVAWWLSRSAALPREAVLLSLAAFVFLLLLLEPLFLRWDLRKP
jgi:hypothetical protein